MRWLVGWSSATAGPLPGARSRALQPVGAQLLWGDPDPLWAVGDWRPDEVRVVHADANARARANGSAGYGAGAAYGGGYGDANGHGGADSYGGAGAYGAASYGSSQGVARLAVLGRCGATDAQLRLGLVAARGGALRHVTAWPGSYTAVLQLGRRITVLGDLAGALPVFHTRWRHGTAYATAALPLADLIEAGLDVTHLAATLACPDAPEALLDGTPYLGVRRVPPGHALILRDGAPEITGYEPTASLAVGHQPASTADGLAAVEGVRDALLDAVRVRLAQPRFVPDGALDGAGPAPGIGADLSGGIASSTLALLAAGLPGMPGTLPGAPGSLAGERLLAVTFNDLVGGLGGADGAHGSAAELSELERAREMAADPRLRHIVVPGGPEALPYADLVSGWSEGSGGLGALTDEPGPALVSAERHRRRLAAGGADHLIGYGARQVLDAHPARLADLLMDRRRRHLLRPVAALTRADGGGTLTGSLTSVTVPLTVYRAARRLARTPYRQGVEDVASALLRRDFGLGGPDGPGGGALTASLAAMVWVRSGPAARWLTGEALAEVSVRLQDAAHRPWPLERPGERRARAALARHAADYRVLEQAATVPSQRLHAPFLDNQVVRACQALPSALRVRPGARAEVLRVALSGAGVHGLPPGWGSGSPAAAGSSAARIGLRSALDPLLDLFEAPLLADAGLVDARVLRGAFRAAASAAAGSGGASGGAAGSGEVLALEGLGEIVATELWLRRLLGRRGSCWTGTDAPEQRALAGGVQRLTL
ncbi:asparagine synthase-related protein [Streptomyces sp. NPDC087270]|uniref:asparagine synthase-related protein n=1 Tax=Streptomyces sp. NPDC087270 TaxID=3365774 RepID=UPI0037F65043